MNQTTEPTTNAIRRVQVIDSHTAGEPTRVVVSGGPTLTASTVALRREEFREQYDPFRRAIVNEPRGSDVLVGALLTPPVTPGCAAGVIFFNNVGMLGMCGHGAIGVITTLAYQGLIGPGEHRLETPVGVVTAQLHASGDVSILNVPAYRLMKGVRLKLPTGQEVSGDVAWGGNWFFLTQDHGQELSFSRVKQLTDFSWQVRAALEEAGISGSDGAVVDHVELFGPPSQAGGSSRSFVLCPGAAYDRSPCGTGTSAKLACLFEDGKLQEGEPWRQESITGTLFEGSIRRMDGGLIPTITGRAYITAEATLILDPEDPCCWGLCP